MSYLEELLPELRKGVKIRRNDWKPNEYIYLKGNDISDEFEMIVDLFVDDIKTDNSWEIYQEPIDWDYIIRNKCLCWFWDNDDEKFNVVGFLNPSTNNKFLSSEGSYYLHCRPVRRGEVTFYEDRKE